MANLDDVIDAHGALLARVAGVYARTSSDRDDLLQDVMVALMKALPRFRGESSLKTYVMRIAHVQGLRHALRRGAPAIALDLDEVPLPGDSETEFARAVDLGKLHSAVRELPLRSRQLVALWLEGLSQKEIAEMVGSNENAVAVALHRARAALRARLVQPDGGTHG